MKSEESPPSAGPSSPAPGAPPAEARVSTVVADRLCAGCGFNLYGQPVLREERYGMFIVRCPECAKIAALQEYPTLGKWATRWAIVLAAAWFLVAVAWTFGSAGATFGLAVGATETGSEAYSNVIEDAHRAWQASQGPVQPQRQYWRGVTIDKDWWAAQDSAALFRASGGLVGAAAAGALPVWLSSWFALMPLGVLGSSLFLHMRRLRPALMALLPVLISLLALLVWWIEAQRDLASQLDAENIARADIGPMLMGISLANGFIALGLGLVLGRPIQRGLIRLLLPPRRRYALSELWICDGLKPPTAGGRD